MHDTTTPLRFRTPPGWPTPSAEWVELFQGAEPAAGWTPADDVPPAPRGWVFWVPTRVLRRRQPRSLVVATTVGAGVAVLSLGVLVGLVVGGADTGALAVAALALLVPLIAGVALWVVGAVRLADRRRAALAAVLAEAARRRAVELPERARAAHPDTDPHTASAAWDAAAWSVPAAHPFHEGAPSRLSARVDRVLTVLTAGVAGLVLVAGASFAVAPPIAHTAESIAAAAAAADGYSDDGPVEVWSSDDGSTTASWLDGDDEWDATCGTTDVDDLCDPYEIDTDRSCLAVVTIGYFADMDDEEPSRVEERTVELSADVPLVLAVSYQDEEDSTIGDVSCTSGDAAAADRVSATQDIDAHPDAADLPDGCDGDSCVAIAVTPTTDCASASVEYRVDAEVGGITDPHDVVVPTALHAGKAVEVFAGGTGKASAVHPGAVTCHATSDDGPTADS
ncbi:hypothetical protein [Curtobacterium sp. MCBA15_012]|uniref:hypothetical protein n=1 Tax=Curtobacterium sp. MCBA15_012 TaxID=1898738 RepID=UPI0008DEA85C|nr:hypothetical protein [Curtobacterium sp. MCBA15_012]WIB00815.1 hypothetical protein QOL15_03720 [Curtobacterium sp. MCBA15_012]